MAQNRFSCIVLYINTITAIKQAYSVILLCSSITLLFLLCSAVSSGASMVQQNSRAERAKSNPHSLFPFPPSEYRMMSEVRVYEKTYPYQITLLFVFYLFIYFTSFSFSLSYTHFLKLFYIKGKLVSIKKDAR